MQSFPSETHPNTEQSLQHRDTGDIVDGFLEFVVNDKNISDECDTLNNDTPSTTDTKGSRQQQTTGKIKIKILWETVIEFVFAYVASVCGIYAMFTSAMWQTILFTFLLCTVSMLGVTAGAHRLWAHRSYKARMPLRVLLAFFFTLTNQDSIYDWACMHRLHHKYWGTDADPHNAKKGFFFAHIGWILCREDCEVRKKAKTMNFRDLLDDPVVYYSKKYHWMLNTICYFILPIVIPAYFWGEDIGDAILIAVMLKQRVTFHQTLFVNSTFQFWGQRPYDVSIIPTDNIFVAFVTMGEGFQNFHYTFPYDYAASEHGRIYNLTTAFIDAVAWLGQAHSLKKVDPLLVKAKKLKAERTKIA